MRSPFLLLEEVAEETRTSLSTVRYWIATGKLASVRPGRRRLVRRADLEAFLENATSRSHSERADTRCPPPAPSDGDRTTGRGDFRPVGAPTAGSRVAR